MPKSTAVIASKLIDNDTEVDDRVKCTLPDIKFVSTELKGAGIMGTLSIPQAGFTESITFGIDLRSVTKNVAMLGRPGVHKFELRFVNDVVTSDGEIIKQGTKIFITGFLNGIGFGSVDDGSSMDGSATYEVSRYRVVVDGQEIFLLDKLARKYSVDGIDYANAVYRLL